MHFRLDQVLRASWSGIVDWLISPSPAASDYPNHLAAQGPVSGRVRPVPWLLMGLVAVCLVPRAMMAWKLNVICTDAIFYIHHAQALENGDFDRAFAAIHLNVFPAVLMVLHRLGLDWELAGKLWGVAMSTLVVLPLFGLARRQFDERVAVAACILYAVHPKLIEWSPELIRGPTFWFLFALSLYLTWRAVVEVRLIFFVAAGASIILAVLTRFEGAFLLIPLFFWSLWRLLALREARARLAFSAMIAFGMGPLLLVLVNITVLRESGHWESIHVQPLVRLQSWIHVGLSSLTADGSAAGTGSAAAAPAATSTMISGHMVWTFLDSMQRGLTPIFALLMFGAICTWRSVWARRDHQPIFWAGLAVGVGTWIHLWSTSETSSRYALSIVIMGAPFAGLGLLGLLRWAGGLAERAIPLAHTRAVVGVGLLSIIGIVGMSDALTNHYDTREDRATAGRWIRQQFGPSCTITGSAVEIAMVGYYAQARYRSLPPMTSGESMVELLNQNPPDAIVLSLEDAAAEAFRPLMDRPETLGIQRVDGEIFGRSKSKLIVWTRTRPGAKVAAAGVKSKS